MQQGMNHDKPYFSSMTGVNMLMFMADYYSFLQTRHQWVQDCVVFVLNLSGFLLVAGVHLIEIH